MVNGLIHLVPISDAQVWITSKKKKKFLLFRVVEKRKPREHRWSSFSGGAITSRIRVPIRARTEYYDFGRAPRPDGTITLCCSCTAKGLEAPFSLRGEVLR